MSDRGYYDRFGGAFLPEILVATFEQLEQQIARLDGVRLDRNTRHVDANRGTVRVIARFLVVLGREDQVEQAAGFREVEETTKNE